MNYPKISFLKTPFNIEFEWMYGFLFLNKWGWEKRIIKKHPKLRGLFKIKNKKKREVYLKNYIENFNKENLEKINRQMLNYEKKWNKIERKYFEILSNILETPWPKSKKKISAFISINPICPRFLDSWSFILFYRQKYKNMLETIMHETCHFLYFKKWKEVFPGAKSKTFDYPYVEWHLSEILAPIILNDIRIQKLLNKKAVFYAEHKKLKINRVDIPNYFNLLYKEHLRQKTNFGEFLNKSYGEIKANRRLFKNLD